MIAVKGLSRSAALASIVVTSCVVEPAIGTPIAFSSNYYDYVPAVSISWADASAAAAASVFLGVNGHLATVTSAAENNFLAGSFDFSAVTQSSAAACLSPPYT